MAKDRCENRVLTAKQRHFVHCMVYDAMERLDAYCLAFDVEIDEDNEAKIKGKASRLFYSPHVNRYYHALLEEVREVESSKAGWTRDKATEKLVRLIEKAESDIYEKDKAITMARLNAIVLSAKELNTMNGYNQTNVNVSGSIVQINGEDDLKD